MPSSFIENISIVFVKCTRVLANWIDVMVAKQRIYGNIWKRFVQKGGDILH